MANTPDPPVLDDTILDWTPKNYWRAGEFDPQSLAVALKEQPELADYEGSDGMMHGKTHIQISDMGVWVTIPDDVAESVIDTAIAAMQPIPPHVTSEEEVAQNMAKEIHDSLATLDPATATPADIINNLQTTLGKFL